MSQSLTFNGVQLAPVSHNNQPWIRSGELATALGYASERSVSNLYARNADEFSSEMSVVINLMTGGIPAETRIFSLRGCHLLAMFARTPVAKQFRVWVLDLLEKYDAEQSGQQALPSGAARLPYRVFTLEEQLEPHINELREHVRAASLAEHRIRHILYRLEASAGRTEAGRNSYCMAQEYWRAIENALKAAEEKSAEVIAAARVINN